MAVLRRCQWLVPLLLLVLELLLLLLPWVEELALEQPFAGHVVELPAGGAVLWVPAAVPVAPMLCRDSHIMRCHRLLWMRLAP